MPPPLETTPEVALIQSIAIAIRQEFEDEDFDEFPGYRKAARSGQVNRTFRAAGRCILANVATGERDAHTLLTEVLAIVASRRLASGGLDEKQIEYLLSFEPPGRDDWFAYLILTPWNSVERLLDES
jgi:hypothetical protein